MWVGIYEAGNYIVFTSVNQWRLRDAKHSWQASIPPISFRITSQVEAILNCIILYAYVRTPDGCVPKMVVPAVGFSVSEIEKGGLKLSDS